MILLTDRLLDLLSLILSGQHYKPLGAPSLGRNDIAAMTRDLNATQVRILFTHIWEFHQAISPTDHCTWEEPWTNHASVGHSGHIRLQRYDGSIFILLLADWNKIGHVLNEFVRNCALPYLEDDNTDVRGAAATTCCRLFVRDPICYQASSHAIEIISDVLDKLLTVGIADPSNIHSSVSIL